MTSFEAIKMTDRVYWVGAIDWGIRDFHGYSTSRGTTYNAFLILGQEPILIDTVKKSFFPEMMARIRSVIDPTKIRYIISNHAEMDHSGSLPETISAIHPQKVFASKMGVAALKDHFHFDFPITEVKHDETMTMGDTTIRFFETRMLHWPDSMFTYFVNEGVLFSQDALSMHLASSILFADQHDHSVLHEEAAKYYANILSPYSPLVLRLLNQLPNLKLELKMIAPDHGPIWRTPQDIDWIIQLWKNWAEGKKQRKAVIFYDTMWGSTTQLANVIADGFLAQGVSVKVLPLSGSHRSDIATELLDASILCVGSPTINQQLFPTVADVLCYLKGLKFQSLIGQVFGSYGWAGEAIKLMQTELQAMNVKLIGEPASVKYVPTEEALLGCRALAKTISDQLT